MFCEKTGCNVFIPTYLGFAHGDAFKIGDVRVFRLGPMTFTKPPGPIHYTIHTTDMWFDQREDDPKAVSTLISGFTTYHGYDGVEFEPGLYLRS